MITVHLRNLGMTPQKMRLIAKLIRGKKADEAIRMKELVDKIYEQFLELDIRDQELRKKFSDLAFSHAIKNWDYKIMTDKLERIYNNE